MNEFTAGAVVGLGMGVVGGLVVLAIALLQKPKECPECSMTLPKFRKPANLRQMLWGGYTCPECGCELDRRGRRIEE